MNIPGIRRRLEKRRAKLLNRVESVTFDVRHSQGLEADFEEQAVQRENYATRCLKCEAQLGLS